ncbi:MAG TPA: hypothetical protein VGL91_13100 [Acidobacteriota bacterium]|jgi:hypothetical protein
MKTQNMTKYRVISISLYTSTFSPVLCVISALLTVKFFAGCKDSYARRVPVSPTFLVAALPR